MQIHRRNALKTAVTIAGSALVTRRSPLFAQENPADAQADAQTVNDDIEQAAKRTKLSMLFRGSTRAEAEAWQQSFRKQLGELLGDTSPPTKWTAKVESRRDLGDHVRIELVLQAAGVPSLPVYLLLPKGVSRAKKAPAVVCVHGHGKFGHHPIVGRDDIDGVAQAIKNANYDYGRQFVRRGYVVAAPCLIPFGRRLSAAGYGKQDPCAVTFVRMQALGKLPIAENLRDLRWCVDLLESRPEVRAERIGCAGLSYGGRMTMLAAAMEPRIKVAAVSGALNLLQERIGNHYSCGSQIIPGLLQYGDYSEVGAIIAPRPCVWEVGSKDRLIKPRWAELFERRMQRVYKALNAADQLRLDRFTGRHRWNGKVAFPLFDAVLKKEKRG